MSQCVPSWDIDPATAHHSLRSPAADLPVLDYEVAELTWENGQLALHGLGLPRPPTKAPAAAATPSKYVWDKPLAGGTLEAIVNQATRVPNPKPGLHHESVPWFDANRISSALPSASTTMTADALVPGSNIRPDQDHSALVGIGCSTRVGSCSDVRRGEDALVAAKRARIAAARGPVEWSCRDQISVSGSATLGREHSRRVTMDTYEMEMGMGFTSTSMGSMENTSSGKPWTKTTTAEDHDSVCHSRPQKEGGGYEGKNKVAAKSSVSTKRSRAAAIHNQSERKRRDKINERMKTLQKLVPNSSKTDKASMLDEVIEYLKQLQAQVGIMSRMNMAPMMLPLVAMQHHQQQLQMSMMSNPAVAAAMGMGLGVLDLNSISRSNMMPNPFLPSPPPPLPTACWDPTAAAAAAPAPPPPSSDAPPALPDPMTAFLASHSHQPMTMDTYSRMAALYQQMQQQLPPTSSNKK